MDWADGIRITGGKLFFSQLSAKSSTLDIYSIPIQASTVKEDRGIPLDLNNTAVIIAEVFIARRNRCFIK